MAKAKARSEPPILKRRAERAWKMRWAAILSCAAARAFAASLLELKHGGGVDVPSTHDVVNDFCVEVEEVVSVITPFGSGVAQVFHVLLVELRPLLVAEVEEGEEEDRQEVSWEVESGVGRVKEKQPYG